MLRENRTPSSSKKFPRIWYDTVVIQKPDMSEFRMDKKPEARPTENQTLLSCFLMAKSGQKYTN